MVRLRTESVQWLVESRRRLDGSSAESMPINGLPRLLKAIDWHA